MTTLIDFMKLYHEYLVKLYNDNVYIQIQHNNDLEKYLSAMINKTQIQFIYAHILQADMLQIDSKIDCHKIKSADESFYQNHELLLHFEQLYQLEKESLKQSQIYNLEKHKLKITRKIFYFLHCNTFKKPPYFTNYRVKKLESYLLEIDSQIHTLQNSRSLVEPMRIKFKLFFESQMNHFKLVNLKIFIKFSI